MKPRSEPSTQEVLAGLVERVTYHSEENGFCVLRIKARGHRDLVTVIGHLAVVSAGEWITASGEWINDRTHGQQFKAKFLKTSAPTSLDGVEKYLGSGMIRGIGPVYAKKLVRAFGEKVFDTIEAEPHRLREVPGIGPVRADRIRAAWAEQKIVREIMVFLHSHGVSTARAVRIYKTYGADAVQVMAENPYRLARDIRGIGFKTADAIATKLGIEKTAMIRVRAGISYALTEALDEGHCGLPTDEMVPLAEKLVEVSADLIRTALGLELTDGAIIADTVGEIPGVFLAGLYRAERTIADHLMRLMYCKPLPWPWIDPEKALQWVEDRIGLALAKSQVAAIRLALTSKVLVMTGGPGVGKTTIVKAILHILAAKGMRLLLCAPTGRAAKRMTEATGFEARTIHRLLEVDPKGHGFKRGEDNPLDCDFLVIDETSMVDVLLMQALLKAIPDAAGLLGRRRGDKQAQGNDPQRAGARCGRRSQHRARLRRGCASRTLDRYPRQQCRDLRPAGFRNNRSRVGALFCRQRHVGCAAVASLSTGHEGAQLGAGDLRILRIRAEHPGRHDSLRDHQDRRPRPLARSSQAHGGYWRHHERNPARADAFRRRARNAASGTGENRQANRRCCR
jgi:exodeoxyribonuclease V alpha subunit